MGLCLGWNKDRFFHPVFPSIDTKPKAADTEPEAWWKDFGSEALDGLIRKSLDQNQDIRQALERVRQARDRIVQTQSGRYPLIDLEGGINRHLTELLGQDPEE